MASVFDLFRKIEKKSQLPGGAPEYIAAGLGNPGGEYVYTRHNAGFSAIDFINKKYDAECSVSKFHALTCTVTIEEKRVLIMKPTTFMNRSGQALREAADYYKIPPERIIVFCDDVNFDPGKMRIRERGSDGGHNGLASVIEQLSSDAFTRVRIGVGKKPSPEYDLASWVLGKIPDEDMKKMIQCFEAAPEICGYFVRGDIAGAMSVYNKR